MSTQAEKGEWPSETLPESWQWLEFKVAWTDYTDSTKKIKQREYLEEGALPIVDQGAAHVGGFTNDSKNQNGVPLPCVVFGDHTRAVKFIDFEFAQGADGVKVLKPGAVFDPIFAYLALRCVSLPDKGYSRHFKFLKSTRFPLPPLAEQRRIVAKLDQLSARSSAARTHLERTKALATRAKQATLAAAFRGELTDARCLDDDNTFGIDRLPKEYAQTPLPTGWTASNVGDFAVNHDARRVPIKKADRASRQGPYPYFGASGIIDTFDEYIFDGRYLLVAEDGANLLSRSTAIAFTAEGQFWVNNHAHILKIDDGSDHDFLRHYLESISLQPFVTGSAQPKLTQRALSRIGVVLPPEDERKKIVRCIEAAFARIDRMVEQATRAAHLLDRLDERLLAKAFRGELVPQDPEDEPAADLLARIQAARAAAPKPKRGRRKKTA